MNDNAKLWARELKSGKWKQTKNVLHNVDEDSYCCLGVACKLAIDAGVQLIEEQELDNMDGITMSFYNGKGLDLPQPVQEWLGLCSEVGNIKPAKNEPLFKATLAYKNDNGSSFEEIANLIESEPEGLFCK